MTVEIVLLLAESSLMPVAAGWMGASIVTDVRGRVVVEALGKGYILRT